MLEKGEKSKQVKENATNRIFENEQGGKPASLEGEMKYAG